MRKKELSILLSKLSTFAEPKVGLEQYPIDGESAATILWNAFLLKDIKGKTIADLGCGTGILGLGALLLGAKHCYFVDKSKEAVQIAKKNLALLEKAEFLSEREVKKKATFLIKDVTKFKKHADTILQNPPFGTKQQHADREFIDAALKNGKVIYSLHKTSTLDFIKRYIASITSRGAITHTFNLKLQLKATMPFHRAKIKRIDVTCVRVEK